MEERYLSQLSQSNFEKLARLRENGINPYPYSFAITHAVKELRQEFDRFAKSGDAVAVASRVMSIRSSGKKLIFLDIAATAQQMRQDQKIQIMIRQNEIDSESLDCCGKFGARRLDRR